MERITGRTPDGVSFVHSETGEEGVGYFTTQRRLPELISRLAAYEDTGLTPEEVAAIALAKKDGRLLELPCKVGDSVYYKQTACCVEGYVCNKCGSWRIHLTPAFPEWIGNQREHWYVAVSSIGKTLFLTRKAAIAALKEMEAQHHE